MANSTLAGHGQISETAPDPITRFLRLFTDIRQGEAPKALLLALNVFLILLAYYILKAVREALILTGRDAQTKSYLGAAQAILFIFVVKAFSRLASRVPRHLLISWVTLFFISNLALFYFMDLAGVPIGTMGIIFFIWVGIFNYLVVAQFWGFANDLYTDEAGKRIFPFIAVGATAGALTGSGIAKWLFRALDNSYLMMLVSAAILCFCIVLTIVIHKREVRKTAGRSAEAEAAKKAQEQPLKKGGGFQLVFKRRYLLYLALLIFVYNFVNATGEFMISDTQVRVAQRAIASGAAGGLSMEQYVGRAMADYQMLTNLLALLIQLFLVSRIFRWVGIGGALLFLPILVLGGYGYASFGASLFILRWVKSAENGTDYSLMNTTKAALFLKTSREEKYKAKAAIDTFFVRAGDTLAALLVFLGTTFLALKIEKFASVNVAAILVWIFLCILIIREYKKLKADDAVSQS